MDNAGGETADINRGVRQVKAIKHLSPVGHGVQEELYRQLCEPATANSTICNMQPPLSPVSTCNLMAALASLEYSPSPVPP